MPKKILNFTLTEEQDRNLANSPTKPHLYELHWAEKELENKIVATPFAHFAIT